VLQGHGKSYSAFLHGDGENDNNHATSSIAGSQDPVVQTGIDTAQNFDFKHGGTLDLTQVLAGAPLSHDLTNIGNFIKVLSHSKNDPGFGGGTKTTLEITGVGGNSAVVNLESSGKLDLKDLLKNNSLILPPH
jgi:hypothetical protein